MVFEKGFWDENDSFDLEIKEVQDILKRNKEVLRKWKLEKSI